MQKEQLGSFQIIVLIILFQLGTSTFLGIGKEAGEDLWIAVLFSTVLGIGLLYLYISIYSLKQNHTFNDILIAGFGRFLGTLIGVLYALHFLYIAARITADFGFFIDSQLSNTNIVFIKISLLILVGYITYLGIETFARAGEIFFFLTFIFFSIIFILFTFQTTFDYKNLLPILSDGGSNVIKNVFPSLLTIPFGEVIAFLCLFYFLKDFKNFTKKGWIAVSFTGLVLCLTAIFTIGILSKELTTEMTFPFVGAIQHITFLKFITHFEVLAVIIFMMGGLVKICVYFYAGIFTLSKICKVRNQNYFIIPILIIIYFITQLYMKNYVEHITVGIKILPYYMHLTLQVYIPLLLLLILFIKSKKSKHST